MQQRCSTWHRTSGTLAALALLAVGRYAAFAEPRPANDRPEALARGVVTAWQKAGADLGWMGVNEFGQLDFRKKAVGARDVPAFGWATWEEGRLAKLPAPGTPFGLIFVFPAKVTDAGLKELGELKSLHSLILAESKITDAGLKELKALKSLNVLALGETNITDAGLKELALLKSLQMLDLSGTKITDAGLNELTRLKGLQTLDLTGTEVTDAGLKELTRLTPLQCLVLINTKVTVAGVKQLAVLKGLRTLNLKNMRVTNAELKELRKVLPNCNIIGAGKKVDKEKGGGDQ